MLWMSAMTACIAVVLSCTEGNSLKLGKREGVDKDRFFLASLCCGGEWWIKWERSGDKIML